MDFFEAQLENIGSDIDDLKKNFKIKKNMGSSGI